MSSSPLVRVAGMPLGPIQTNCYFMWLDGSSECVIVDPGGDAPDLIVELTRRSLTPVAVLVTHCHWDHIGAVSRIANEYAIPVYMSAVEAHVLADIDSFAPAQFGPYESHVVDVELEGTESFELAGISFDTMPVPGHSPGSLAFLTGPAAGEGQPEDVPSFPVVFIGDLIFAGSVGRTDLPFSNHDDLLSSARSVLSRCTNDTVLLSGHGPATTVGHERSSNPYLADLGVPEPAVTS